MTEHAHERSRLRQLTLADFARFALVVLVAFLIGGVLNRTAAALEKNGEQAGFARGMIQGALMPCTLPALLLGHDVAIYSVHNDGIAYKLGYTVGVNLCGAAFFGLLYRRISRWRGRH